MQIDREIETILDGLHRAHYIPDRRLLMLLVYFFLSPVSSARLIGVCMCVFVFERTLICSHENALRFGS